jgi:hypothetical protein
MTTLPIRREVMDLLVMLDKSQSAGNMWTSTPGTVFEKDVLDWAVHNKLIEVNTIDGEDMVYRITEAGQLAMIKDEAPIANGTGFPKVKADMAQLLNRLAQSNDWVLSQSLSLDEYPYYLRQTAQRRGYVEGRGNNAQREFKITKDGLAVLKTTETLSVLSPEEKRKLFDDSKARIRAQINPPSLGHILPPPPLSIPSIESSDVTIQNVSIEGDMSVQEAADFATGIAEQIRKIPKEVTRQVAVKNIEQDCDDCGDCLYRDVVALLEKRVPGVREIMAGLKAIRK